MQIHPIESAEIALDAMANTEPIVRKLVDSMSKQIGWKCPYCVRVSEFKENIVKHMEEHDTTKSEEELREKLFDLIDNSYGRDRHSVSSKNTMTEIIYAIQTHTATVAAETRNEQTFKVIQSLVKSGAISDRAAASVLAIFAAAHSEEGEKVSE